jgi:hypothetical protein
MEYLPGSPDYLAMQRHRAYKGDMYDRMATYKPAYATATTEPNTGIAGPADKKRSGNTQNASAPASYGKKGNTHTKDYAKMSESQPREVQKTRKSAGKDTYKGGKPKSIADLRKRAKEVDGDWHDSRSGKVVG